MTKQAIAVVILLKKMIEENVNKKILYIFFVFKQHAIFGDRWVYACFRVKRNVSLSVFVYFFWS